jgi:hypothetical protein
VETELQVDIISVTYRSYTTTKVGESLEQAIEVEEEEVKDEDEFPQEEIENLLKDDTGYFPSFPLVFDIVIEKTPLEVTQATSYSHAITLEPTVILGYETLLGSRPSYLRNSAMVSICTTSRRKLYNSSSS